MKKSFKFLFGVTFIIALILLIAGEWLINKSTSLEHIIGWAFVASFIAALVGILGQKSTQNH